LRHIELPRENILILAADDHGRKVADEYGVVLTVNALEPDNYRAILEPPVGPGDFLLNLSVDVSSEALIEFCLPRGVFCLEASIEPWAGGYIDASRPAAARSNHALREEVQALRQKHPKAATAAITHGANPGLIPHWVKQGLVNVAGDVWGKVVSIGSRSTQSIGLRGPPNTAQGGADAVLQHCAVLGEGHPGARQLSLVTEPADGIQTEGACRGRAG